MPESYGWFMRASRCSMRINQISFVMPNPESKSLVVLMVNLASTPTRAQLAERDIDMMIGASS